MQAIVVGGECDIPSPAVPRDSTTAVPSGALQPDAVPPGQANEEPPAEGPGPDAGPEEGPAEDAAREGVAAGVEIQRQVEVADGGPAHAKTLWIGVCVGMLVAW